MKVVRTTFQETHDALHHVTGPKSGVLLNPPVSKQIVHAFG